jgi:hypothetical protein
MLHAGRVAFAKHLIRTDIERLGHANFLSQTVSELVGVNVGVKRLTTNEVEESVTQGNPHRLGTCGVLWKRSSANW